MAKVLKSLLGVFLLILPIVCLLLFAVSIVCFTVSLNPDVKWNEYSVEVYPGSGYYALYYNTLWSSIDVHQYEGKQGSGVYMTILKLFRDESWKDPIRSDIVKTIGLAGGAVFFLIVSVAVHATTKQKLFVILLQFVSAGSGIAGGYFCMVALSNFKKGLILGILESANKPIADGGYYFPDQETMKLGYLLSHYGSIISLVASFLVLTNCGLYIPFGEGKWIWQKKANNSVEDGAKKETLTPVEKISVNQKN